MGVAASFYNYKTMAKICLATFSIIFVVEMLGWLYISYRKAFSDNPNAVQVFYLYFRQRKTLGR